MAIEGNLFRRSFEKIGARAKTRTGWFQVDVKKDRKGEYFEIAMSEGEDRVQIIDVRRDLRHLLLRGRGSRKILCGHDERHWFAAAVANDSVSNVITALDSLKPHAVRQAEEARGVRARDRFRRKNKAFIRQGEWFFVPVPGLSFKEAWIRHNEPLRATVGSKPHMCEQVCRSVSSVSGFWMRPDYSVDIYARGRVSHPDHKTIYLNCWHRVFLNTQPRFMSGVAFLD